MTNAKQDGKDSCKTATCHDTYDYTLSSLVSVQRDGLFLPSINLLFVDFCPYFSFGVSW